MSEQIQPVSLDPDTFVGTGFLEDKDAVIHEWKFVMFDFNGAADEELPMLSARMTVEGSDKERMEYWKMGSPDRCAPTKDGKGIGLKTKKGLSNASKGYLLLKSLRDAGVPKDMINGGDITVLNGIDVHFVMLTLTAKDDEGKEFTYDCPIVSNINAMPGEEAPKAKEAKAEEEKADADLTKRGLDILVGLVDKAEGKQIAMNALSTLAFNAIDNDDPDKSELLGIIFNENLTKDVVNIKNGVITLK